MNEAKGRKVTLKAIGGSANTKAANAGAQGQAFGDNEFYQYILEKCFNCNVNIKINDIVVDVEAANEESKRYVGMKETFIDLKYRSIGANPDSSQYMLRKIAANNRDFVQDVFSAQSHGFKGNGTEAATPTEEKK